MAIMPKESAPVSVQNEALSSTPAPEVKPDLSGFSKQDLAGMLKTDPSSKLPESPLKEDNQPDLPPETKQPEARKPLAPEDESLKKFKNPDGSINTDNLLKSYLESEKTMSRQRNVLNDVDLIKVENQELRQQLQGMMEFKSNIEERLQAEQEAEQQKTLSPEELAGMTPEEQQEYFREAARAEIRSEVQKIEAQREMDNKIQDSIREVTKLEGYEHLQKEINDLLQSDIIDYHPDAPRVAYYAALGHKTPDLIVQAKNMGFSEGYAKAKEEMGKVVDTGKATAPINIDGMNAEQLTKLSKDELRKMLPRFHDETYTIR